MDEEQELEQLMQEALDERDNIGESEEELETEVDDTKVDITEPDEEDEIEEESEEEELVEEESDSSDEEEATDFTPIEIEVSGHNVTINSQEEMMEYIRKGASTFNKEPETHVEEKLVIDQGKLTPDDLKLLVEAKNGSKEAIAKLAQLGKVDVMELDEDSASEYKQQVQYSVPTEVDRVATEIMSDETHATEFRQVIGNLPNDFTKAVSQDANMLSQFSQHIKSGLAQEVIPKAINASMTNGKSFLQNYAEIGQQVHNERQNPKQERQVSSEEQRLRNRANSSKGVNNSKASATTADDIDSMTDKEFADYTADPSNFTD